MSARSEWLDWRRGGLGGSDIGAILGQSKWRTEWGVWHSKIYGEHDDRDDRSRMTGRLLEEAVGKWSAHHVKADGLEPGETHSKVGAEWMKASSDYFLRMAGDRYGLECKTAERPGDEWGSIESCQIPASYESQCRWYQAVWGIDIWYLGVFFRRTDEWRMYKIERDLEWEAETIAFARNWWQKHIVERNYPEPDSTKACADSLAKTYPTHSKRLRVATSGEEEAVRVFAEVSDRLAELDTHRNQLRNYLREIIRDDEGVRFTGGFAKWHRPSNRITAKIR